MKILQVSTQLPIRLSAAQQLINQYSEKVDSYISTYFMDKEKSELFSTLEHLKDKCTIVAENMLHALGYNGNLFKMETELNENIRNLQKDTFFLNGQELMDFIYEDLSNALPADPQYQLYLNQFIEKLISLGYIKNKTIEGITIGINEFFGRQFNNNVQVEVSDGVGKIKGGRDILGRFTRVISENFYKNGLAMQKDIEAAVADPKNKPIVGKNVSVTLNKIDNGNELTLTIDQLDKDSLLNFLRVAPKKISDDIAQKANILMKQKIMASYNGSNPNLLEKCIDEITNKQYGGKLKAFFVGNNVKQMTGILGEIQALYYIKSIIKTNNVKAGVAWIGGKQNPHADLLLAAGGKNYGIQVKNTTLDVAKLEINFESFNSKIASNMTDGMLDMNFLIDESTNYTAAIKNNPTLFEAATQFLGMEMFNIPYVWNSSKQSNQAEEKSINEVPPFYMTRKIILTEADRARQALTVFMTGMMYMQLDESVTKNNISNSLYIIGGTLAITSATILADVIKSLEKGLNTFDVTMKATLRSPRKGEKKDNLTKVGTIVDFLNAGHGKHFGDTKYTLQSSYTFLK